MAASTTPDVTRPASSHEEPGACSRPPDGDARRRNTPIPADMAAAASQSRRLTFTRPAPATARYPNTNSSSSARMGWTRASAPYRSATSWRTNPPIMLTTPSSQTGCRARRSSSQTSKPAVSVFLAPMRWHTEAVAVQMLAATASMIAVPMVPDSHPQLPGLPDRWNRTGISVIPGGRPVTRVAVPGWLRRQLPARPNASPTAVSPATSAKAKLKITSSAPASM